MQYGANKIFKTDEYNIEEDEDIETLLLRGENIVQEHDRLIEEKIKKLADIEDCTFSRKIDGDKTKNRRREEMITNFSRDVDKDGLLNEECVRYEKDAAKLGQFGGFNNSRMSNAQYNSLTRGKQNGPLMAPPVEKTDYDMRDLVDKHFVAFDWQFYSDVGRIRELLYQEVRRIYENGNFKWYEISAKVRGWCEVAG
jgi:hypothetical protein